MNNRGCTNSRLGRLIWRRPEWAVGKRNWIGAGIYVEHLFLRPSSSPHTLSPSLPPPPTFPRLSPSLLTAQRLISACSARQHHHTRCNCRRSPPSRPQIPVLRTTHALLSNTGPNDVSFPLRAQYCCKLIAPPAASPPLPEGPASVAPSWRINEAVTSFCMVKQRRRGGARVGGIRWEGRRRSTMNEK